MDNKLDFSKFKDTKSLQTYANDQFQTILKMQAQSEMYQSKIEHLEELLRTGGSTLVVGSNELEICRIEIARLYAKVLREPLEDKEVRIFETYCKTLLAIQGKTVEAKPKKKDPVMTPEELISIALQQMPEADEQ